MFEVFFSLGAGEKAANQEAGKGKLELKFRRPKAGCPSGLCPGGCLQFFPSNQPDPHPGGFLLFVPSGG